MDTPHGCRGWPRPVLLDQVVTDQPQPGGHQNQEDPEVLHSVHPAGAVWIHRHSQVLARTLGVYL